MNERVTLNIVLFLLMHASITSDVEDRAVIETEKFLAHESFPSRHYILILHAYYI